MTTTTSDSVFRVLKEPPSAATKLQRYILGRPIGSGNFAVVREARDTVTGASVAVKIMEKARCGLAMCRNEVDILLAVRTKVMHERLTPVLDVFEDDDRLYIVLELMRGGELYERVSEKGRLDEFEAAHILRKLIYALEALHRHGILHRDIKLENIVLKDNNEAAENFKLADFGFATDGKYHASSKKKLAVAGTLGYAAPEVLRDQSYTPACDVWGAGVVLYIMLAGYIPFPRLIHPGADPNKKLTSEEEIAMELEAILVGRAPEEWRRSMREEPWLSISPEAKNLLAKMLEIDPDKRIKTSRILQHPFIRRHTLADTIEYTDFE